ncbi:hypothetical protein YC2023_018446 [Brassica napus]
MIWSCGIKRASREDALWITWKQATNGSSLAFHHGGEFRRVIAIREEEEVRIQVVTLRTSPHHLKQGKEKIEGVGRVWEKVADGTKIGQDLQECPLVSRSDSRFPDFA